VYCLLYVTNPAAVPKHLHWQSQPKVAGELNDFYVKLLKLEGPFVSHHHDVEDELFFVVKGALRMAVRENGVEREIVVQPGEFIIMPRGVEHCPSADEETHVLLLDPNPPSTRATWQARGRCENSRAYRTGATLRDVVSRRSGNISNAGFLLALLRHSAGQGSRKK